MTKAWEREKARMHELYMVRGMKLSQLQIVMREQHNFHASERAYKQKFKEWKWFKKTPRNSGISLGGGMRAPVEPPLVTSRGYKMPHAHTSHHLPRHSTSSTGSSPVDTIGHPGQVVAASAFSGLNGNSDQSGFPDSQHSVLGLVNVHSSAPIRTSENFAISLPPVSRLQLLHVGEGVKESVLQAVQLLDTGKFEDAERFLSYALKSLQWYRGVQ